MNRTSVQIMASKYHCQKEWGLFAEVIDFKTREGEIQNKPGASCVHRKNEVLKNKQKKKFVLKTCQNDT